MNELRQKYQFDLSASMAAPYQDAQIKNYSYKAIRRYDDLPCHLVLYKSNKPGQINSYHKKITKTAEIKSNYLVPILDCFKDDENSQLFIVLEWNQSFNLKEAMKQDPLSEAAAFSIIKDVLMGVREMHKLGMLHSFINIENIEVLQGRARLSFRYLIYKTYYLAPQVKYNHQKSVQTDLFSLGVCLYRLVFGTLPFKQKTDDQYAKSVKKGISRKVNIPKCNFPIFISEQAQEIINSLCHFEPKERERCYKLLEKYETVVHNEKSQLITAALGQDYKLVKIEQMKEQVITLLVLHPKQKRIYSMEIIEHNLTELSSYIEEIIAPFKNQANLHFANVKEFFPVLKNSIAIVYNYCAQGNLKNYRRHSSFDKSMLQEVQNMLNIVLTRWVGQYRFLDYQQILIKQGRPVLKFPPYPTKELKSKLKQSAKRNYFYAPELQSGVQSQSADSWSVGMLEYWMRCDNFASFDKEANLIIKDKSKLTPEEIQNLNELLTIKAKDRKNLFPIQAKPRLDPERKLSVDSQNSGTESPRKSLKVKSSLTRSKNKTLQVKKLEELPDEEEGSQDLQLLQIGQNSLSPKTRQNNNRRSRESDPALAKGKNQSNSYVRELNVFDRIDGQSYEEHNQNEGNPNKQKRANRRHQKYPPTPKLSQQEASMKKLTKTDSHELKASALSEENSAENKKLLNRFGSLPSQVKYSRDSNQIKHRNSVSKMSQKSKDDKNPLSKYPAAEQAKSEKLLQNLKQQSWKLSHVDSHWSKPIRVIVKCLITILLYLLIFYLSFLSISGSLLSNRYNYTTQEIYLLADKSSVTATINFTLLTHNTTAAYSQLNNQTLDFAVNTMRCITNKYWTNSIMLELIQGSSFATYAVVGIMVVLVNLVLMVLVLAKLDFPKAVACCSMDDNNYVGLYSWLVANLAIATLTSMTFILYGGLFELQLDPCLSWTNFPSLQLLFRKDSSGFALKFSWIYALIFLAWIIIIYIAVKPKNQLHKYVYGVLILLYIATVGARSLSKYNATKQAVIGACGQLLSTVIGLVLLVFDMIVSCCLRKNTRNGRSGTTMNEEMELNVTEADLKIKK